MKYQTNKRRNKLRTITAFALSYLMLWGSYPVSALAEAVNPDDGMDPSTVVVDDSGLADLGLTTQNSDVNDETGFGIDNYVPQNEQLPQDEPQPVADVLPQDDPAENTADPISQDQPADGMDGIDLTLDTQSEEPGIDITEGTDKQDGIELENTTDDGLDIQVQNDSDVKNNDLDVDAAANDSIGIEDDYEDMGLTTQADAFAAAPSNNVADYHLLTDYEWSLPSTSALYINANGMLERVEYVDGNLIVETMASSLLGLYTARKTIDASTYRPSGLIVKNFVWGGFYAGAQYNFVVTGQDNPTKKDSLVVIRVSKYDKSWKYLGCTEITAAAPGNSKNTMYPFSEGYVDMYELNGKLHIRTAHTMYGTAAVTGHQASLHLVVNEGTMALMDHSMKYTLNQKTEFGYVSHSFNQRLAALGNTLYSLDHGDAYPRAITVKRIGESGTTTMKNIFNIAGSTGLNFTGVTMGGFETSSKRNTLLATIATIDQSAFNSAGDDTPRNISVLVTNADFSGTTTEVKLTNYKSNSKIGADIPKLVKVNDDLYCVMWAEMNCGSNISWSDTNQRGKVSYILINGKGEKQGSIQTINGYLSDCEPVMYGNLITWYSEDIDGNHLPIYYTIDYTTGLGAVPTFKGDIKDATIATIANQNFTGSAVTPKPSVVYKGATLKLGSDYEVTYVNNVNVGVATATVVGINGYSGSQSVSFNIKSSQGTPTITAGDKSVAMGSTVTMGATVTSGAGALTYTSSDPAIATVDPVTGMVTPKAVGDVTITIQSAENANWKPAKGAAKVTVQKGTPTITASNKSLATTSTASLGATVTSGAGALSYASSNKAVVTVDSTGKLKPVKAGTAQVSITSAANNSWNSVTKKVTVTVTAAAQPMTVKAATKTAKQAALKSKAVTVAPITVSKAQGAVTYVKSSGASALSINKTTGKVTIKKGTKKGTYTMQVKVNAAGNTKYKAGSKTVKVTIKVS